MLISSFFNRNGTVNTISAFLTSFPQVWHSSDSVVNVCSELDWKRCLAVHLWFMLPPTASVADALARYEAAFQVSVVMLSQDIYICLQSNLKTFLH